jgi:hypothetical protein
LRRGLPKSGVFVAIAVRRMSPIIELIRFALGVESFDPSAAKHSQSTRLLTTVVTEAALVGHGPSARRGPWSGRRCGSNFKETGRTVADFLSDRLKFSRGQKDVIAKHPMAHIYSLSKN